MGVTSVGEPAGVAQAASVMRVSPHLRSRRLGDEIARQRELREAHRLFTEMGATARAV